MGIKRFPVGADEGLVERFDEVAYRRRVSRNRLIVELMEKAVAVAPVTVEIPQPWIGPGPQTDAEKPKVLECSHPKEKRKNLGYGTRCEECGGMVK